MQFPFFGNKFNPKRGPARKAASLSNLNLSVEEQKAEFGSEVKDIKVKLGSNLLSFEGGDWIIDDGQGQSKEVSKMKKQLLQVTEERNLWQLKTEILLDMLAKKTAENQMQSHLIDELKKQRSTKSR